MMIAGALLLAIGTCQQVTPGALPAPARRALVDYGGDVRADRICVARANGATVYRMRDSASGIFVEVAPDGRVVRREWSGRW